MAVSQETHVASGQPADRLVRTCAYFVAFIGLGMVSGAMGPSLPTFAENTGSRLDQISLLFVARSSGYFLGAYQGGRWYDRLSGHKVMAAVLAAMAAMLCLAPTVSSLTLLAAVIFVLGVANGALDVGGNTLLVWVHGRGVGPFMNGLHLTWGIGALLSPLLIAASLQARGDIDASFWVMAFVMLPMAGWLLALPSPARQAQSEGTAAGAGPRWILLGLFVFFLALFAGSEAGFGAWVYSYALRTGLATTQTAASLTSTYWAALTAGRLFGIPLATRVAPQRIVLADLVVAAASVGLILAGGRSASVLWIGTLGLGLAIATVFPMALAQAERIMTITGRVSRWFFVGASAGGIVLPWLIGQVFEGVGPRAAMGLVMAGLAGALLVYLGLLRYVGRRPKKEQEPA